MKSRGRGRGRDEACPFSTGGGTRRVHLVRGRGRGREGAPVTGRVKLGKETCCGAQERGPTPDLSKKVATGSSRASFAAGKKI